MREEVLVSELVKIKVAVIVNEDGRWFAEGWDAKDDGLLWDVCAEALPEGKTERRFWLTAELPIPEVATLKAAVEEAP
jgi:hypothetical protein